jgi:glycosyltransferase involved in cell wall biosynthesis
MDVVHAREPPAPRLMPARRPDAMRPGAAQPDMTGPEPAHAGPHIVIFEPGCRGHQMILIRYLLDRIARDVAGARVTLLTTEDAADFPSTRDVARDFAALLTLRIAPVVTERHRGFAAIDPFYEYQWRNAESLTRALAEIGTDNVDFVLLPYLETIGLPHIVLRPRLFRGLPWACIAISIQFHQRKLGFGMKFRLVDLLQGLFLRGMLRQRSLVCCGTVNPYLASVVRHPKLLHCPDPGTPYQPAPVAEARAAYGLRPETCVVVVFGVIDQRKRIDVLLEGAARLIPDVDLTVLLAGPRDDTQMAPVLHSAAARRLREHGRLVECNRYILVGKDVDPLGAADISWVFREERFVIGSSVLIRSALFRRAVIGRNWGAIGRQITETNCGIALSSEAPEEVAAALTMLANDKALREQMGANGARAFADHTPENFARPIVEAINQTVKPR